MPRDIDDAAALAAIEAAQASNPWPAGFYADGRGIWWQSPASEDTTSKPVWIASRFDVVAETVDETGQDWGLLLRWCDRDGRMRERVIARRSLHADGNQIAAELESEGLSIGTGKTAHDRLKDLLGKMKLPGRRRCVRRTGWHLIDGNFTYVLPAGQVFGAGSGGVVLQTEHSVAPASRSSGTLAEWQNHVAAYAIGNYRIGLFIAAAFAAPLLDIAGEQSGGVHVHGASQTGKTTLLRAAASVWGSPGTDGYIRTWRATDNGIEGVATETCDALLALDELGMVDARIAGEIVYSLANESGKARAGRDGSARARRSWRTMFVSTGETTLATKMGERGGSPMAGQEVRLANLPADAGAGMGVFQNLHGHADGGALARYLRSATRACYGTPAPAFLSILADFRNSDPRALQTLIQEFRERFIASVNLPADADGQVTSVAWRFALIAAAGELAVHFGVLPWPDCEATAAVKAGLLAWIAARGGVGAGEDVQAVTMVRRFIEQHADSRFKRLSVQGGISPLSGASVPPGAGQGEPREVVDDRTIIARAGYRRDTPEGSEYLIFPEQWGTEVVRGLDPVRAARAVAEAGYLDRGEGRNLAKAHKIPGVGKSRFYTVKSNILRGTE